MTNILILDDEENIVKALLRILRAGGFHVDGFTDPHDALKAIETNTYALIMSDYRMPEINGVEFLEYCRLRQPDTIRIILSAQCDKDAIIEAINRAEIYRFLNKPWETYDLMVNIHKAVEHYTLLQEHKRLLKLVASQNDYLRRLEEENPGITRVSWDEDGAIILPMDYDSHYDNRSLMPSNSPPQ